MGAGTRICVGAWVQWLSPLLVVDNIKFAPPDEEFCGWNGVGYVIVFVSRNNGICTKAPFDEVGNDPDSVLIIETSEFIAVYIGEELNENHFIYGLVGTFCLSIDWRGITTSGLNNNFMENTYLHEVCWDGKSSTFINPEDGSLLDMLTGELNEVLYNL